MTPPSRRHLWLVAVLCAALLAAPAAAADPWAGIGTVSAPGGAFLRDGYGRRLQLHGVDLVAKCGGGAQPALTAGTPCIGPASGPQPAFVLSPTARDPARRFTAGDARSLARLGFTVVRLGIVWQGLEPGPPGVGPDDRRYCTPHRAGTPPARLGAADPYDGAVVAAYLARTDRIVALLAHAGLRVIIDMHQDAYGSVFSHPSGPTPWTGEGAPAWATCTDGLRLGPATAYWGRAYVDRAVEAAIGHFWRNDVRGDPQGQFARVWQAVARHYRDNPDVIGYEVFNEPTDFLSPGFGRRLQCAYAGRARAPRSCAGSHVQAVPGGLIGTIEAADPAHLVVYEPADGVDTVGVSEPLHFPRLVLAFHLYGTSPTGAYGDCPGTACLPAERKALAAFITARAHTRTDRQPGGPAMIMDEFGGSPSVADIAQVAALARRDSLSWSYWSALQLHDPTGTPGENLLNARTARPWPAKAQALASPYPLATAGTPGAQAFDPASRAFSYAYAVDRSVHAPTEIVVPPYSYPGGYRVVVRGAAVISAPGASLLRLSPRGAGRQVTVNLRPADR